MSFIVPTPVDYPVVDNGFTQDFAINVTLINGDEHDYYGTFPWGDVHGLNDEYLSLRKSAILSVATKLQEANLLPGAIIVEIKSRKRRKDQPVRYEDDDWTESETVYMPVEETVISLMNT